MESVYSQYAWLIPLFPLLAFLILIALGRQAKVYGAYIGIAATLASLVVALLVFVERIGGTIDNYTWSNFQWIKIGSFSLSMGYEVTNLNALMLVIVTVVSVLVNVYSLGYMKDDERISVFFSYIALFTFSMLGLVLSVNIVQLYIFWELVGVCSFLLVGFWYFKPEAKAAAKKAFIVTRIGDVGLFIAILLLFWYMPDRALDFTSIHNAFSDGRIGEDIAFWIALLIFIGAVGKSGQFPLHTWLPDAMEGPTPISALIHAATMVAAGVFLVARTYEIFIAAPAVLTIVAFVGVFTALFAATIAIAQKDIKRILAYSTISQLGYMMMALGIGTTIAYTAGLFHLMTHAFFKALLFLVAGSVIHAVHTQNIHEMGGLMKTMKITAWTFVIGALALSGIFPLSGFWSKDAILVQAFETNLLLFWLASFTALLTAFYMARLFFIAFTGPSRSPHKPHESPAVMTVPLIILAALAVVSGFVYTPMNEWLAGWLSDETDLHGHIHWNVMLISTLMGLGGLVLGWFFYGRRRAGVGESQEARGFLRVLANKYYIDEIYEAVIVKPVRGIAYLLNAIDEYIVDGLVRLTASATVGLGKWSVRLQNGQVQTYGLITALGFAVLALALVGRRFF